MCHTFTPFFLIFIFNSVETQKSRNPAKIYQFRKHKFSLVNPIFDFAGNHGATLRDFISHSEFRELQSKGPDQQPSLSSSLFRSAL